ncbi:MAG: tetratricopeptide repeat protein [Alicyclobacillus sp.]|nr:tetratricopeptide repeat protein [Alicyclobacillus sp.]
MFLKLLLVYVIYRITGNPMLAVVVLLVIFFFVDRRYFGLVGNLMRPIRRRMRMSSLHQQLQVNPHDTPARLELAEALMETNQYRHALALLEQVHPSLQNDPQVLCDIGACRLAQGDLTEGEALILKALDADPRVQYGLPYLRLATAYVDADPAKALGYLEQFQQRNFSSCESFYRLAQIQRRLGNRAAEQEALRRCVATYRSLPRFRKRSERRWVTLARLQRLSGR